jgi:hypothetical protein
VTRSLRSAAMAAAAAVAFGVLSGCGAGTNAQSLLVEGGGGENLTVGSLALRNVLLVAGGEEGDSAALVAGMVNQSDDPERLIGLSAEGLTVESTLPAGGIEVPPRELVSIGSAEGPYVTLYSEPGGFQSGRLVELTMQFEQAGAVQFSTLIQDSVGPYATVSPSPRPIPTPTEVVPTEPLAETESPGATPEETLDASPAASPTAG